MSLSLEQDLLIKELMAEAERRRLLIEDFMLSPSRSIDFLMLKEGIHHAYQNALSLLSDAEYLIQDGRFSRCFTLSHCAIEEVGKMAILHAMCEIPRENQKLWAYTWKNEFRNHQLKYSLGAINLWTDLLYRQLGASFRDKERGSNVPERLRQLGLYVEYLAGEDRWGKPTEMSPAMANEQLDRARCAIRRATFYIERNLYAIEYMTFRRDICGKIYPRNGLLPSEGESYSRWIIDLLKVRQEFFQEMVNRGILIAG